MADARASEAAGNAAFADEDYEAAVEHYTTALAADPTNAALFVRRSNAHSKLEQWVDAVSDATSAIKLAPTNPAAHFRKVTPSPASGVACFNMDEHESALAALKRAVELEPSNSQYRSWLEKTAKKLGVPADKDAKAPLAPASAAMPCLAKARHDWYQTGTHVYVTVYTKGRKREDVSVVAKETSVHIVVQLGEGSEYQVEVERLCGVIVPERTTWEVTGTKVEVKLEKAEPNARWEKLDGAGRVAPPLQTGSKSTGPKNWDKIVKTEVSEEEKLEGDAALQRVFQQIYGNASDEQKRAMIKSYTESGGTVLSTNWDEVGKKKVEGSAPDGQEMHTWDELTH
eukprot:m51a1_g765 putative suppressor of g2 allele of skp1 homolog isoform 1 (342) ;mRNA; f:561524-562837